MQLVELPAVPELLRAAGLNWRWMTPGDRGFVCSSWFTHGLRQFATRGWPAPKAGLEHLVEAELRKKKRHESSRLLERIWNAEANRWIDAHVSAAAPLVVFDEALPTNLLAWRNREYAYTKEAARRQGLQRAMAAALAER
jgi:hypothetical protein